MGGGTDVAGDAASVVLMGDRLGQLWEAVELGRATMSKIRQNLGWAGACTQAAQSGSSVRAHRVLPFGSSASSMMGIQRRSLIPALPSIHARSGL